MDTNGIFDTMSYDSDELNSVLSSVKRESYGEEVFKEVTQEDGYTYKVPWRKYYFSVILNHGLCRTADVLPPDTLVTIRLTRAPAAFALMKIAGTLECKNTTTDGSEKIEVDYDSSVIPLIDPIFSVYYASSPELEQLMSRVKSSNMEIPFLDYVCRQTILDSGLSSYDITLLQGDMPKYIFFAISDLERLTGSDELSLTRFIQGDLNVFNLLIGEYVFKYLEKSIIVFRS